MMFLHSGHILHHWHLGNDRTPDALGRSGRPWQSRPGPERPAGRSGRTTSGTSGPSHQEGQDWAECDSFSSTSVPNEIASSYNDEGWEIKPATHSCFSGRFSWPTSDGNISETVENWCAKSSHWPLLANQISSKSDKPFPRYCHRKSVRFLGPV